MRFLTQLTAFALAAAPFTHALALPHGSDLLARQSPSDMVTSDYTNGVACGAKNPWVNMAISAFCNGPSNPPANDLMSNSAWSSGGMKHDDITVKIIDHGCPSDSQWIPMQFCLAQFHYTCAVGNLDGTGVNWFGTEMDWGYGMKGCQEMRIDGGDGAWDRFD